MVSLFSSLNIASNALSVNESAISVVSHNVANMNTEGYSKQRVNLATRNIAGAIGNNPENQVRANGGVMIANVIRYNDAYLNDYYRTQLATLQKYNEQLEGMGDLADIFNDLDGTGIGGALSAFYESLNNLNEYPASSTARVNFIESVKSLTSTMNSKYEQLQNLTGQALGTGDSPEALEKSKAYAKIEVFNNKLDELAAINKSLTVTQTGSLEANNLLDKRDKLLNEIAEFVDFRTDEKKNGSVDLYVGDVALVKGSVVTGKLDIMTAKDYCTKEGIVYPDEWYIIDEKGNKIPKAAAVVNIVSEDGTPIFKEANDIITSGSLGGLLHAADLNGDGVNIGTVTASLNKISQVIADVFNDLNTREGAYSIDPNNTGRLVPTTADNYIFVGAMNDDGTYDTSNITAGNIKINPDLLKDDGCWNIACAYFENPDDFDERAVGNAQNVVDMLATRSQKLDPLNGMSIEDFYTGLLGKIAAGGSNAQMLADTQQDVVDSIYNKITANNSVDLNQELVDMVKYQTAYAASAKVFNTVNNCLDVLMSLGA